MKIVTLFGTRPEIIRLSSVIKQLDLFCDQVLIHTGQNYDTNLSDIFFEELGLRSPDIHLGIQATTFADQVGRIIAQVGEALAQVKPDRLLVLGDTNSALAAVVAARMGIPVYHMEAGNRCYDDRVPEEVNRRIVDHCSTTLMPYTYRSKENLVREGIEPERIFVTGNPIYQVLSTFAPQIEASTVLSRFDVESGAYFLATLHRSENVDTPDRLSQFLEAFSRVGDTYQQSVLISVHPRTASQLARHELRPLSSKVRLIEPLGLFDFVKLERNARVVLSDSGTVQEECTIFNVPSVTLRDVTERPETIECGSNILTGSNPTDILKGVELALGSSTDWMPPVEYIVKDVASTVVKIVLGQHSVRRHHTGGR